MKPNEPKDWKSLKLGDVLLKCHGGAWGNTSESPNVGVIRTTNISDNHILDLTDVAWRQLPDKQIDRQQLFTGDVIMTKSNSIERVGACAFFRQPEGDHKTYIAANFCQFLRFNSNVIEPEYGFFWLISPAVQGRLKGLATGTSSSLQNLNGQKIKDTYIKFPNRNEQRRIVARIKEAKERIEEIERLRSEAIDEAKATLPSMLNDAFVKLGARYGTAEIGDVTVETRYGTSRKCSYDPKGIAILRIPNVAGGYVNFEGLKYCSLDKRELSNLVLQSGDFLFVRTNGSRELVGRCAIYEGNEQKQIYGFASYLIRVRLDQNKMRPHFLAFFLNSTHGRVELDNRRRTSAGQYNINSENLRNIKVPLPPIAVQDSIIETLRDRQIQVAQLQEELCNAQKTESHLRESILRKAFSGEL